MRRQKKKEQSGNVAMLKDGQRKQTEIGGREKTHAEGDVLCRKKGRKKLLSPEKEGALVTSPSQKAMRRAPTDGNNGGGKTARE